MATETSWIQKRSIELIVAAMERSQLSARALADTTGIPFTRVARKLVGGSDFTFSELYLIAAALGVSPSDLVPSAPAGAAA